MESAVIYPPVFQQLILQATDLCRRLTGMNSVLYRTSQNVGQILRADSASVVAYDDFRIHTVPFGRNSDITAVGMLNTVFTMFETASQIQRKSQLSLKSFLTVFSILTSRISARTSVREMHSSIIFQPTHLQTSI